MVAGGSTGARVGTCWRVWRRLSTESATGGEAVFESMGAGLDDSLGALPSDNGGVKGEVPADSPTLI